ncbi:hypothetical protein ACA910_011328 [Epithemia clementina (nom. ined.)]
MFSLVSGIYQAYLAPTQLNILIVGASGAGKTTMLERCKVTQMSTKTKPMQQPGSKGFEDVPNVPVHWLKPSTGGKAGEGRGNGEECNGALCKDGNAILTDGGKSNQKSSREIAGSSKAKTNRSSWLCPAPRRYAEAAIDGDDDDDEEINTAVHDLGDIPSPAISRKVVSPPSGTVESDLSKATYKIATCCVTENTDTYNYVEGDMGDSSEATDDVPLDDSVQSSKPQSTESTTVEDDSAADQQKENIGEEAFSASLTAVKEYDLKPKSKMLALTKIRRTIGMNLGKINALGVVCNFWDLGGRMFELWERYYNDADAVIFVWKTPPSFSSTENSRDDQQDDDDDSRQAHFDYSQQLSLLEGVRSSIPDDVPFLVLGHVFMENESKESTQTKKMHVMSSSSREKKGSFKDCSVPQTDVLYSTARLLPHYHNPYQALFFANAANGQGVRSAMEWLIPIAKRQLKVRETRRPEQEGGINK